MKLGTEDLLALRTIALRDGVEFSCQNGIFLRMVFDSVHEAVWPYSVENQPENDSTPEPILRSLLTYCYTVGIFGSDEIESAARHDPIVRYLCANYFPRWETIRDFRRRNNPGLKQALIALIRTASRMNGNVFLNSACEREAEKRLVRAVQADSMALDN